MNIKYKLKKTWFAFWQKYKLRSHLKIASKLLLIFIIVWLLGSILTILSQWAFTDNFHGTPFQCKYLKYFWPVIIELISGYDIQPDSLGLNIISNVLSVVVLITGIIIFAVFTGQIVSMFIHVLQRTSNFPEKPNNFKFKRPIIICGVSDKLYNIIKELRKSCLSHNREIIVVDENADTLVKKENEKNDDVWYVKGNQADRKVLESAFGEEDSTAVILATSSSKDLSLKNSDSKAIQTALAIEGHREKNHTVLELIDERNIPHLEHTKINEWISTTEYGIKLVSQSALQHGLAKVYWHLLGGNGNRWGENKIYFTRESLPEHVAGVSYRSIRDTLVNDSTLDITLIGFARDITPEKSPTRQYIKQLNPVNAKCRICNSYIPTRDHLGRVHHMCKVCYRLETRLNKYAANPLYFPADTLLEKQDKLIYLSKQEADFNQLKIIN